MVNVFIKNIASKWQSNSIDLHSAYIILSAQTIDQIKNWYVFVDDGKDVWLHLMDSPLMVELLKNGGVQIQPAVPALPQLVVPLKEPVVESVSVEVPKEFFNPEAHEEMAPVSIVVESQEEEKQYADKRQHPRFDIRLRVIIKSGKNTFMTYTSDVSLGGMSLINDVPEYIFSSEAEIYITAPDQKNNLKLICSPVASKLGKSRLMFTKIEEEKKRVLATWLHHVIKPNATKVTRSS